MGTTRDRFSARPRGSRTCRSSRLSLACQSADYRRGHARASGSTPVVRHQWRRALLQVHVASSRVGRRRRASAGSSSSLTGVAGAASLSSHSKRDGAWLVSPSCAVPIAEPFSHGFGFRNSSCLDPGVAQVRAQLLPRVPVPPWMPNMPFEPTVTRVPVGGLPPRARSRQRLNVGR